MAFRSETVVTRVHHFGTVTHKGTNFEHISIRDVKTVLPSSFSDTISFS